LERAPRVAVDLEREVAAQERHPAGLRRRVEAVEQPLRALEPAARDGRLVAEVELADRELHRDARGAAAIVALPLEPVRARQQPERARDLAEPAARVAGALERLRRLRVGEGGV